MKGSISLLCLSLMFVLSSCFKEEDPLKLPQVGENSVIYTFEMGSDYSKRFYFDLGSGTVPTYNSITDWDLAFDCREGLYYIWLNSSKAMYAANLGSKEFNVEPDVNSLTWKIDIPTGDPDSNAIGEWADFNSPQQISYGYIYVIDLGRDENNNILGYRKMEIISCENDQYKIKVANLDGSDEVDYTIGRNPLYNFTYFSLNSGSEILIEPTKTDWDLVFTRYSTAFYVPSFTPYQVTGVLSNPSHASVSMITNIPFEDISLLNVSNLTYSSRWDAVGYEWKDVDISNGSYTVYSDNIYIIKDNAGDYYKLRFLDFTNDLGENGFPKVEYQKL